MKKPPPNQVDLFAAPAAPKTLEEAVKAVPPKRLWSAKEPPPRPRAPRVEIPRKPCACGAMIPLDRARCWGCNEGFVSLKEIPCK